MNSFQPADRQDASNDLEDLEESDYSDLHDPRELTKNYD